MLRQTVILVALTCTPLFELRFSIPVAILGGSIELPLGLHAAGFCWKWYYAFLFCVAVNIVLGPVVYLLINLSTKFLLRFRPFAFLFDILVRRTRWKIEKYVTRYGTLGIALFIGVPLPGSGSYSGALGAYVLGLTPRQFFKANVLGVLIAGTLVTLATVTGQGVFRLLFG